MMSILHAADLQTVARMGANGAETGEFLALSFGAREQLGAVARLAYADLLKEVG